MKIFIIAIASFIAFRSECQISLPQVEAATHPNLKINGGFSPSREFLNKNPEFLKSGKYSFANFTSDEYPAIFFNSSNKLNGWNNIRFRFVTKDIMPVDEENAFNDPIDLNYHEIKNMLKSNYDRFGSNNEHGKKAYIELNNEYIKQIEKLAKSKDLNSYSVSNLGVYDYDIPTVSSRTLIFEFEYVDNNLFTKGNPLYARYRLNIKNVFDSSIKTYNQVVFFDGKVKDTKYLSFLGEYVALYQTFPIAFESLLNQFLEDSNTKDYIIKNSNSQTQNSEYLKDVASLIELKYTRLALLKLLDIANTTLKVYGKYELINYNTSNLTQDPVINSVTSLATTVFGSLDAASQAKGIEKAKEAGNDLIGVINAISTRENDLFSDLQSDKIVFNRFINSGTYSPLNSDIASAFKNNVEQAYKSNSQMRTEIGNSFTSFMQSASKINFNANSTQAETMAMTNGGNTNTAKTMDICQQQATAAWYKSAEYNNYMRTKSNADAYDSQAKIAELTLQYCSDKLPPNEIAMIKQTIANCKKVANDLRRDARNSVQFNLKN